ncbi:hypothetical protein FHR99_000350 [Litorivivens lipolytica]|uniref:Amidohydrolase 3 domain-containing protein n=1 Tax=Litorivivens lipolytica TaxID=1524264 RepID=A0A7W4Z438_9GAMM|nr:amidohydrolase [Litorivivens lipolytica]MBB3046114.1 hypothetical protein [Litorivivens lipolytica]
MKKILWGLLVVSLVLLLAVYFKLQPERPPQSQVFMNARVLTMDPNLPVAEAVAVQDARIVAVGSRDDMTPYINADTVIHDLNGKTLMPGFIDAHGHFPASGLSVFGLDLNSPPIGNISSMTELLARLTEKAAQTPEGEWVFGYGYDDTLLQDKRHPTRLELDEVSSAHPIAIWHISGHMLVANSKALALAGIDENTPNPEGGVIVKDPASGELTGLLEEEARIPVLEMSMDLSVFQFLEMIKKASVDYLAKGVTVAQSGALDGTMMQGLWLAQKLNLSPLRLELWPYYDSLGKELIEGQKKAEDFESDQLNLGAIKITADGSIQGFTGYLSKPYHTPYHGKDDYRGYPTIPRDELTRIVTRFHKAGYQLAIHGNGDASIDDIIHAFSEAQKTHFREDPRLILVHAQMAREDQLLRMKELGITPTFFSAHTYYWGDRHRDIFMGPERAANMSPAKSAVDLGLRFTTHLDTPVVPMDPLMGAWTTVNRKTSSGKVIGPHQRISVEQALRAITIDAAWQIFREDEIGSVTPGKLADLVVLERDPLSHPKTFNDIPVMRTVIGGVTVYSRD